LSRRPWGFGPASPTSGASASSRARRARTDRPDPPRPRGRAACPCVCAGVSPLSIQFDIGRRGPRRRRRIPRRIEPAAARCVTRRLRDRPRSSGGECSRWFGVALEIRRQRFVRATEPIGLRVVRGARGRLMGSAPRLRTAAACPSGFPSGCATTGEAGSGARVLSAHPKRIGPSGARPLGLRYRVAARSEHRRRARLSKPAWAGWRDQPLLGLLDVMPTVTRSSLPRSRAPQRLRRSDRSSARRPAEHDHALDVFLKLAHVAGPRMAHERSRVPRVTRSRAAVLALNSRRNASTRSGCPRGARQRRGLDGVTTLRRS